MISQEDASRLMWLAEKWVDRALAVHGGDRPCNVKEYKHAFATLVAQLVEDENA